MVRSRAPAANHVREFVAAHVDVGAIDEDAIADVPVTTPLGPVGLVRSDDDVAVPSKPNHIIPVACRVGH